MGRVIPAVGLRARVTVDWTRHYIGAAVNVRRKYTYEGTVIESESYDDPNTFRLYVPEDYWFPQKVIPMDWVSELHTLDTAESQVMNSDSPMAFVSRETQKPSTDIKTHLVKGSKGNNYTVTEQGNSMTCDCLAGQHGRRCKHVQEVMLRNAPRA